MRCESELLKTAVYLWEKLEARTTKTGMSRPCFRGRTGTLDEIAMHATTLNPGEMAHPPHQHPEEEMIICREGTLEANINGQPHPMSTGSVLLIMNNDLHGVRNVGPGPATYYVLKWWPPGTRGG